MIAADHPDRRGSRLLAITAGGSIQHLPRGEFSSALAPGDLVIANDAATLPSPPIPAGALMARARRRCGT